MVTIGFTTGAFNNLLSGFEKTLTRTPRTKDTNPLTGEEVFTDGTSVTIKGPFFRREDDYSQDKQALFQDADAVLMVKPDVTINRDDTVTYESEDYRVHAVITRKLGTTSFYKLVRLYLVG
jgi:hypothetical protein